MLGHWHHLGARAERHGQLAEATGPGDHNRVVVVLDNGDVADLVLEAPRGLHTLADGFSAERNTHSPMGVWCRGCARPHPCPTRTRLVNMLVNDRGGVQ